MVLELVFLSRFSRSIWARIMQEITIGILEMFNGKLI